MEMIFYVSSLISSKKDLF